ncbi:MAG: hypothetical protein JNL05_03315, partial [Flavobacteriales bacterium]|nr:hypothetical protein [Flavobacteriales bacterium]
MASAQSPTWNWARTLDAGQDEYVRDLAIEPATGNIYAVGSYRSATASPAPYGLPISVGGSGDAFIAKFDPSGNLLWSRSIGSSQEDAAMGVAVASSGLVVVTGYYGGSLAGFGLSNSGSSDAFIIAYDATGAFQWTKSVRSPQWDEGTGIAVSGNTIIAYGSFSHHSTLSGVLAIAGLSTGRLYAYLNAYDLTGALLWSLTGLSNDNVLTERIASDATHVYVVGSTEGNSFGWQNNMGVTSTSVSTTNMDALYCSAISLTGTPSWTRLIDNPGDSFAECNGVAVDCGAVYITGHTHNGSIFPGGVTRTMGTMHDYWFLASLSRSTGTTNWVRTAASSTDHGVDGYDVSVGRNGQVHVAGSMDGTVTTDGGTVITAGSDADICISRFNRDGTAVWYDREVSPGDEWPLAIATVGGGNLIVGGWYKDALTLGASSYPGNNGMNMFTASLSDPAWASVSNNPARFAQPGPFCTGSAAIDLNTYLVAYADTVTSSSSVTSPMDATGAPNSAGAFFNTLNGWVVLDLSDTLYTGEGVGLTWRSQTNLQQARMLVSSSMDGIT